MDARDHEKLISVLERGQTQGLLGPASVVFHVKHAQGYMQGFRGSEGLPEAGVDIGSGGGLPGLVLAWTHPEMQWLLVDGRRKSTDFLTSAVEELGLGSQVTVLQARMEELGRESQHRGRYPFVTARSFGPPAVVAECAAPLLAELGTLIVSEPPEAPPRWPADGLALLGMTAGEQWSVAGSGYQSIRQASMCPDRYPRRTGIPAKRPLFS